jgi:negative regulator of flagellin synthesis FlgM
MHISGTTHIHGPHGINAPHSPRPNQAARQTPAAEPTGDRVEISPAAEAAVRAADAGEIRQDLVNRIRAQIADGTYETPEKLGAAVDRLLDEIG